MSALTQKHKACEVVVNGNTISVTLLLLNPLTSLSRPGCVQLPGDQGALLSDFLSNTSYGVI